MAQARDDGFHEIQLNGKQLVFLFMAVTVVSVVIFLCGVLVGRGVPASAAGLEMAGQATEPLPPPPDPGAASATPNGAPIAANEPLSYPDRLTGDAPVAEKLSDKPTPPPAARKAPAPKDPPSRTAEAKPSASAPAKDRPIPEPPAPRETASRQTAAPREPAGAGFAIQVAALRDKTEAESMARRLSGKGYSAYVVAPAAGAPAMYRVRVGKFTERRQADVVAARLQKEEQFKPWIVR